jgi:hypothetical protein
MRQAVLPTGHPEENQPQIVGAGRLNLVVDHREIELPFLRLDQVPGDNAQHRIEIRLGQPRQSDIFIASTSDELVLASSPATQINGRPSTMSLVIPSRFSRWGISVFAAFNHPVLVLEIHAAGQKAQRRHDHVVHQGFDHRPKRPADDHADGQIDHVPLDGEFLEFVPEGLGRAQDALGWFRWV